MNNQIYCRKKDIFTFRWPVQHNVMVLLLLTFAIWIASWCLWKLPVQLGACLIWPECRGSHSCCVLCSSGPDYTHGCPGVHCHPARGKCVCVCVFVPLPQSKVYFWMICMMAISVAFSLSPRIIPIWFIFIYGTIFTPRPTLPWLSNWSYYKRCVDWAGPTGNLCRRLSCHGL